MLRTLVVVYIESVVFWGGLHIRQEMVYTSNDIPLWRADADTLRQDLQLQFPFWAATSIQGSGKYLGFHIGPLAGSMSWEAPLQKYLKAAKDWGALGLGLHLSTLAYGIYILPVLSFVAQLSNPPDKAWEIERKALSLMVPGGYKWILPEDLFRLKANFGQAASFPSLKMLVQAALVASST